MNHFKIYLLAVFVTALSFNVSAESAKETEETPKDITQLLKSRLGGVAVSEPVETPADGIYQTQFGSRFAYLTGNGRYAFIGDMIDLETQVNLTEMSRRDIAKNMISNFAEGDLAVFPAGGKTQKVLNVFTDTSCPYCKKLHEEVPELQRAGIEVRYFPFPRGGARGPGYAELRKVWCGEDLARTMDIAKGIYKGELPAGDCERASIVDQGYALGNRIGVEGTPALFTQDGQKIEGYVPFNQLIPMVLNSGS
jgi:thiol:disulfide interchange protein DsbC